MNNTFIAHLTYSQSMNTFYAVSGMLPFGNMFMIPESLLLTRYHIRIWIERPGLMKSQFKYIINHTNNRIQLNTYFALYRCTFLVKFQKCPLKLHTKILNPHTAIMHFVTC